MRQRFRKIHAAEIFPYKQARPPPFTSLPRAEVNLLDWWGLESNPRFREPNLELGGRRRPLVMLVILRFQI
ncbi:unnamed protein product [Victoria cruziana]